MAYGNLNVDTITGSGASSVIVNNGTNNVAGFTTGNNLQMLQNGGGIVFSNSSATTNSTLNDYETGTWTPVVIGSGTAGTYTLSNLTAWYTKVGNLVTVSANFGFSAASGGSGYMKINGLPFSYIAGGAVVGSVWTQYFNFAGSPIGIAPTSYTSSTGSGFELLEVYNNAGEGDAPISGVSTSTVITFSVTYKATF